MIHLVILVEGHSEESFVNNLLCPHLINLDVYPCAIRVETKRNGQKGGLVSYIKAKNHLIRLINSKPATFYFSTMFDLYALPNNFPDYEKIQNLRHVDKALTLERALLEDIQKNCENKKIRFIPYIQLHEFEALLLVQPHSFDCFYFDSESKIEKLNKMVLNFSSPEEINQGHTTAPSKRIIKQFPSYENEKPTASALISKKIGLDRMRKKCPHFNDWITQLEQLKS